MNQVKNFLPSRNGLPFINTWPDAPDITVNTPFGEIEIGHASGGLCGGMAFTVRDLFEHGFVPIASRQNPAPNTPAFQYIASRLIQSFDLPWGVLKFYEWMAADDSGKLAEWTINQELPLIQKSIDAGQLCPIGLVRAQSRRPQDLGENHQVVVWGYDQNDTTTTLALYDPNWPGRDNVTVSWNHTLPFSQIRLAYSTGEATFGLFPMHYAPRDPSPLTEIATVSNDPSTRAALEQGGTAGAD